MAKKKRKTAPKGRVNLKHLRQKFILHYQQGRIQQALAVIAPHINMRPPNGQLLIDATICYVHLHQWQDAVVLDERAIALMPDNIPLLDGLSHSHGVLKNWESAKLAPSMTGSRRTRIFTSCVTMDHIQSRSLRGFGGQGIAKASRRTKICVEELRFWGYFDWLVFFSLTFLVFVFLFRGVPIFFVSIGFL